MTDQPVALTIGKFDSVHLGHQRLINTTLQHAREHGLASVVLTFDPHPDRVIFPDRELRLITTVEERIALIEQLGPDFLIVAPFTAEIMNTSAAHYMHKLCAVMPLREIWVGEDFALGRNREGNIARLRQIGQHLGYTIDTVPPVERGGAQVRTARVRRLLLEGAMREIADLLGRPFSLSGVVIEGDRRGQSIGFPTANVEIEPDRARPGNGVYACRAYVGRRTALSATNVGMRPTFGALSSTIEAHLLDWYEDLYGQVLRLEFIERLRPEQRFTDISELITQIQHDITQTRVILRKND
ncbi:MAG: bifunctional riboflavin kinase/FAD synthetase [Chloroflexaceae bacterium]|nr:bifunctional riboflavin kinase/FAD synthetase [Chloroflexaceae bacterium]